MNEAVAVACTLAQRLPVDDLRALSDGAMEGRDGLMALRARAASNLMRWACDQLLAVPSRCSAQFMAGALAGAAQAVHEQRQSESVDVVWTGPASGVNTSRLTAAVIAELIGEASNDVVLVSYAAHTEQVIDSALRDAKHRGVDLLLLLERREDNPGFRSGPTPFPGLNARRLAWPAGVRPSGASLHAKALVVDGRVALVGSANLTSSAMERNLECGVLLRGGPAPTAIRDHLLELLTRGVLQTVTR
jgi:phosphatidylserine/phosphatidylglycerophosphate/cardiolipin synthase-like enzyme